MAAWNKEFLSRENGEVVQMQVPEIISASRSTDIPAFYADWFFYRLEKGYSAWTNPFNGEKSYISYKNTRFIVFWSKNPRPLLKHLDTLDKHNINCYIQYTLNDYESERLEQGVPKLEERIDTFKRLVDRLGKSRVIWRFDPLILTDKISMDDLLNKIDRIGDKLKDYTEKLVFSYADILLYRKVKNNLDKNGIHYREWDEESMLSFAERLATLNKKWGFELATCGEKIDLEQFGIHHNHCVDDELMIRLAYNDDELMKFLGVKIERLQNDLFGRGKMPEKAIPLNDHLYAIKTKDNRDKGQRLYCGCMISKDIGEYNTCLHLCEYCYANATKDKAVNNYKMHRLNPLSETITGK